MTSPTATPRTRRIVKAPSRGFSALGGTAEVAEVACTHEPARLVSPWVGEPGTSGTVAVVGAGKMGLPLAAQFASHGWHVIAVDIDEAVIASINAGLAHFDEPGLSELVRTAAADGLLRATTDAVEAARQADVVVLIVPIVLDAQGQPEYRTMDAAVDALLPGTHPGQLVIFETTLPVGDTRNRYGPRLAASGLTLEDDLFVAFSPERLYSGAVLRNLSMYPKLVGGLGDASTARAAAFYESVLDAEIVAMSSAEAAEFAKLAETTYRDVNIALANEFARYASEMDVDVREVIAAANSQPYSHVHEPGLGVGGHCIPVYPRFLLSRGPSLPLVALARTINDGQLEVAVEAIRRELGDVRGQRVLVLGLTYRAGVKELAYSTALALIKRLAELGAEVHAYDPLLSDDEVSRLGAIPWAWGSRIGVSAIVTQTADPLWDELDPDWFPELFLLVDGRNSLPELELPTGAGYVGVGVPRRMGR